QRL
ncbi:arginosuccinate synthase family protein, partial [Vibrio parahaemolyticus V-223/04]